MLDGSFFYVEHYLLMFIFTFATAQLRAWKGEFITLTSSTAFSLAATLC